MKWAIRRSRRANEDLLDIWLYVASDNPPAAYALTDGLIDAFETTADFPHIGRSINDILKDHRVLSHRGYVIIYRTDQIHKYVELTRVFHGARRWQDMLS